MNRLRALFLNNVSLKVLSLLLAVLIHLVVSRDNVREFSIDVPVGIANVPEDQIFVGDLPEQVHIRVRGRWRGIREMIRDRKRKLICDLGTYQNGERFVFDLQWVTQQLGTHELEVLGTSPSAIDVRLEKLARRKIRVEVSTTGEPALGFRVSPRGLSFKPRLVEISGPASVVRSITRLRAAPVDLAGADSDLRVRTRLMSLSGGHIKMSTNEIEVHVKLKEQELTRSLPARRIVTRGCPEGLRCPLEPSNATVRIHGLARAVRGLLDAPPDNLIFADIAPAIARKERKVQLRTPPLKGLTLTVQPATAHFRLLGEIPAR